MAGKIGHKLILGAIVAAAVVAVAGYLTERGIRIEKIRPTAPTTSPEGRTPGDQQARGLEAASLVEPDQKPGQNRGKSDKESQRGGKDKQTVRGGTRGHDLVVGNAPIHILVNGQTKTTIRGRDLQDTLEEVTVVTASGPRTGWAVADILHAHGIDGAKQVAFTNKEGKSWSADWKQVSDAETRVIVTYSQNGSALLVSGPIVQETSRKRTSPRELKAPIRDRTDLVLFPDVVKIDVAG